MKYYINQWKEIKQKVRYTRPMYIALFLQRILLKNTSISCGEKQSVLALR
ncbi:hypothetical protein SAMN04488541_101553 [Thermoflexibacter ruber]|uniref:Uncharacterized protein n=1 Tax=Thermoflexibacter ruber TaxID=1003 RepID=A0A1I2FT55_9BACT|nr:hypothetical protein SAMN04488541_101553 [Thermoflexibacter ruber]